MSNNALPDAEKSLLALAEDCADGCHDLETELELKAVKEETLRAHLLAIKGDPLAVPPVVGLMGLFKQADAVMKAANAARGAKDEEGRVFLRDARANLLRFLGRVPSPEWVLAGFGEVSGNSNGVPESQAGRLQTLSLVRSYLTAHPEYQQAAGTLAPEVTPARALALHEGLSDLRSAANAASTAQTLAKAAKSAAVEALRQDLILLVRELNRRLGPDDARWETFGLNIPNQPRAPEPAEDLVLSGAGPQRVLAEWERGMRSDGAKVMIQVMGVDAAFRLYCKSGDDGQEVIKDLPSGAMVRVQIITLNGALEAASGPVAEMVVP